jgi:hypothetical protein
LIKEPFDPETFVDQQFKNFNLAQLCDHQQTIFSVFHQMQGQPRTDQIINE